MIRLARATTPNVRKEILKHIAHGSLVFEDKARCYLWLTAAGFVHRCANHSRGDFSRTELLHGEQVNISTNAVEGLLGRVKTFAREWKLKNICKKSYGLAPAEYLRRQKDHGRRFGVGQRGPVAAGRFPRAIASGRVARGQPTEGRHVSSVCAE